MIPGPVPTEPRDEAIQAAASNLWTPRSWAEAKAEARAALAAAVPHLLDDLKQRIEDPAEMVPVFDDWTRGYAGGLADALAVVEKMRDEWTGGPDA